MREFLKFIGALLGGVVGVLLAAASFRAALGALFMDPSSPVWEDGPEVRQGIDFFSVTREKSRGGGI